MVKKQVIARATTKNKQKRSDSSKNKNRSGTSYQYLTINAPARRQPEVPAAVDEPAVPLAGM
ncbi:MAG: hypothetical protein GX924_02250 [Clostridiaceae bacterium]|nr:hypothetical protein [Clostridiaceae bacterium]